MANFEISNGVLKKYYGKDASVTIPDGVTAIGDWAFVFCKSITSITIPDDVTSIGNYVFAYCENLQSIVIPSNVTSIGENAFDDCPNMQAIYCKAEAKPEGWHEDWLGGCPADVLWGGRKTRTPETLRFSDFVIDNGVLIKYKGNAENVVIPKCVTSIDRNAFAYCKSVKSIKIPEGVTSIGHFAFTHCENLQKINLPCGIPYIGTYAFSWCERLEGIIIPGSVTSVDCSAFLWCKSLKEISVPISVTTIEDYAFHGCEGLASALIPSTVTHIGEKIFGECKSLKNIHCSAAKKPEGWNVNWRGAYAAKVIWSSPEAIEVEREERLKAEKGKFGSKTKHSSQEDESEQAPKKNLFSALASAFKKKK